MRVLSGVLAAAALAVAALAAPATAADDKPPTLLGRAILPSDAYQPGPPSGAFITGDNGVTRRSPASPSLAPRRCWTPVTGSSGRCPTTAMAPRPTPVTFLLRLYRIRPDFKTATGGTGTVAVLGFLQLRDPDQKVPFPLFRADRR